MIFNEVLTQSADCDLEQLTVEQESFLHDQTSCKYKSISLNLNSNLNEILGKEIIDDQLASFAE